MIQLKFHSGFGMIKKVPKPAGRACAANPGRLTATLLLLISIFLTLPATASEADEGRRVGLVLSGGGAKGFAHIGVLKVLEEVDMPVDIITGTSMGSIIGALYAIGYSAGEIEQITLNTDWPALFADKVNRRYIPIEEKMWDGKFTVTLPVENFRIRLPEGLVPGHNVSLMLSRLTWPYHHVDDFNELPIPFACVATNLENGEIKVFRNGFLPDVLRASSAIPTVFLPVKIDGNSYVDGGLARNLPVREALDMGADYIIAINASAQLRDAEKLKDITDVLNQTINLQMLHNMVSQEEKSDLLLHPDLTEFTLLDFEQAKAIINLGEKAARSRIDEFKKIADSLNAGRERIPLTRSGEREPIYLTDISVTGLDRLSKERAIGKLNLDIPTYVTLDKIEDGMDRLYSLKLFDRISYRLENDGNGYHLKVVAEENARNLIRIGLRYDSWTRATLLLNQTFYNVFYDNSTVWLSTRFGEQLEMDFHLFSYHGYRPKVSFGLDLNYTRYHKDLYEGRVRTSILNTDALSGELFMGTMLSSLAMGGVGARSEWFKPAIRFGSRRETEPWTLSPGLFSVFWLDTYDRAIFPNRGQSVNWRSDISLPGLAGPAYSRHELHWGGFYRLGGNFVLAHEVNLGYAFGRDLPFHHRFFAGGYRHFPGYRYFELSERETAILRSDLRYEFVNNYFLTAGVNAGHTLNRFLHASEDLKVGWHTTISLNTLLGPISFTLMGSARHPLLAEFNAGFNF